MTINLEYLLIVILILVNVYLVIQSKNKDRDDKIENNNNDTSLEDLKDSISQLERTTSQSSDNMNEMYTLLTKGGSVAGKFGEMNLKVILESDQLNKDNFYKKHQNSVKNHLKSLSSSNYRELFNDESLDLIIMFMPIEGAYILACDEDMIKKAANEKIAIVGPTTLIAILQIISRIWSSKRQSEATNLIIKAATDIYDKTRLVGDAFEDLERSLEQANKSIDSGKKRTKNLVNKVEKMRTIGGLEPTKDISDKLRIIDKE